ncbi:MAG TPA: O-antigen ligase family protein [Candidatus Limnocylindrales bacterium]|nr:O-antigen ligase family protein [Candidatus Limnocylindrales bacterium]
MPGRRATAAPSLGDVELPAGGIERLLAMTGLAALGLVVGWLVGTGRTEVALGLGIAIPGAALVLRFPFLGIVAWVLLVPYFLGQQTAEVHPVRWLLHRIMPPALLFLVGLYHALGIRRARFRVTPADWALVAFVGLGVVNVLAFSVNPARMLVAFYDKVVVAIVVFWLIRALSPGPREIRWLVLAGLWTLLVQSAIGILSWVAPDLLPAQWLGRVGERTVGTFGGPAPYTITLVLFALLAVHEFHHVRGRALRTAIVLLAALAFLAVFLSLSRGSWLGAAVAVAGLAVVYPRFVGRLALAGAVVFGILAAGPLAEVVERAPARLEQQQQIAGRIVTNDAALRMIATRPLTGFGYGNFERFDEQFKRRIGDIPLEEGEGGSAHNTYLALAAENGLPGLLLYLAPAGWLALATVRSWRRLPAGGLLGRGLVAVLWLSVVDQLLVTNFMDMLHAQPWGTTLYWLTLGLIAVVLENAGDAERGRRWETVG